MNFDQPAEKSPEELQAEQAERRTWLAANLKSVEAPETREAFIAWIVEEERLAHEVNISEASIRVSINTGILLRECGIVVEAEEQFGLAWDAATQEADDELRERLKKEIDDLIRSLHPGA